MAENTFNSDGMGTYTFSAGSPPLDLATDPPVSNRTPVCFLCGVLLAQRSSSVLKILKMMFVHVCMYHHQEDDSYDLHVEGFSIVYFVFIPSDCNRFEIDISLASSGGTSNVKAHITRTRVALELAFFHFVIIMGLYF